MNTGIFAASIPGAKPLFKALIEKSYRSGSSRQEEKSDLTTYGQGSDPKGSNYLRSSVQTEIGARTASAPNTLADNISEEGTLTQSPNRITRSTMISVDRGEDDWTETSGWQKQYSEHAVDDIV